MTDSPGEHVYNNIACTRCGCVCDDLQVTVQNNRIQRFSPGCTLAESWFASFQQPQNSISAKLQNQVVSRELALQHTSDLLKQARAPLFFGLSRSSTDGQRTVCELADALGATIDTTASLGHGPSIVAFQSAGESTSTLGEVRHRSDMVIYWGCDPVISHPRHVERIVDASGLAVPEGRRGRRLIVIDTAKTATADIADQFIQIEPGRDFEVLWALRLLIRGQSLQTASVGGVPTEVLQAFAEQLKGSHYGAVFFGVQLASGPTGHGTVEALLRLGTELNRWTRFVVRRMRVPGDVTGADSVLCWQTGYPFSINLNRGYPRYNPGEYSAEGLLARGEVDCLVLVGGERVDKFSDAARNWMRQIPVILLDPEGVEWDFPVAVRFYTAVYGIHRRATAYRMDEVPIPLRQILTSELWSDDEVLRAVLELVQKGESHTRFPSGNSA